MTAWIYILRLVNQKYYIGSTTNLPQRLIDHQQGKSNYTSKFLPVTMVFHKEFHSITEAQKMEKYLKKLKSRQLIEKIVQDQIIHFNW